LFNMFRKFLHMLVVLPLLISTVGVTLSKHYCHGTLKSIEINSIPESCCDTEGCCHNESENFQLKTDFNFSFQHISFENLATIQLFFVEVPNLMLSGAEFQPNALFTFNYSPPPQSVGVFLSKIQVFLI